jgi:hypothetical protein
LNLGTSPLAFGAGAITMSTEYGKEDLSIYTSRDKGAAKASLAEVAAFRAEAVLPGVQ